MSYALRVPLVLIISLALCSVACGEQEADTEASRPPPRVTQDRPEQVVNPLDEYGNLKSNDRVIFGFALPESSYDRAEQSAVPVIYIASNEARLLRFYRSRGHTLIKTNTGWHITHTDRTLQRVSDPASIANARIYARQGPGAGWTLLFDSGAPIEIKQPPLMSLLDLSTPPVKKGQGDTSLESGASPTSAPIPAAKQTLERAALKRKINTRRAKDVSTRIYQHVKRKGTTFLD